MELLSFKIKRAFEIIIFNFFILFRFSNKNFYKKMLNLKSYLFSLIALNKKRKYFFNDTICYFNFLELLSFLCSIRIELTLKGIIVSDAIDYLRFIKKFSGNVLDVGAFKGDTAILFHKIGAKKILAVEPLGENVKSLKKIFKN